jgi:hypothetical protein
MTIHTNSGLKLYMESAKAAAKVIEGMTLAAPGVITITAHGYADGDVILIDECNVTQLDGRAFVVSGKTVNTFQLLGVTTGTEISTVGYDTFVSGNVYKITLGTSITGVKEFGPKGGDIKFVDTTTVHDKKDQQIVVGSTAISYDLTMIWDPADSGQTAMINAFNAGAEKVFKILWPNGRYALFNGSVGYGGAPGGANQGVTTSPAAVALTGNPTYCQ